LRRPTIAGSTDGRTSRIEGFYRRSLEDRISIISEWAALTLEETAVLAESIGPEQAEMMVENVVGRFSLPLGIGANFLIDGRDYLIPMAVEEPSVVAGASSAALLARAGGGFTTGSTDPVMIAQIQLLDVADLCHVIVQALTSAPEHANRTFNIGASEFGTLKSDFQAVLDYAGFGKRVLRLPSSPAGWMLGLAHQLGLSPVYPWVFRNLTVNSAVDITRARNLLGFHPSYSNRDALIRNFEWYLRHRDQWRRQTGITHTVPWAQGLLGLAKRLF